MWHMDTHGEILVDLKCVHGGGGGGGGFHVPLHTCVE